MSIKTKNDFEKKSLKMVKQKKQGRSPSVQHIVFVDTD